MAEALAHDARLGARLERQRLGRADAQRLVARVLVSDIPFSNPVSSVRGRRRLRGLPCRSPVRKRSRRGKRARNVSLAGPASRAACTTFDRPNAKSNWAVVKALMTGDRLRRRPRRRSAPASLRDAVGAGIRRMQQADDRVAGDRRLGLGEAGRDQPGLAGDRERIERGAHPAGARSDRRDPACTRTSRLKPRAKTLRFDRVLERRPLGRDPQCRGPAACA